ncbi:hypothetical protein ColLi_00394 [Colletotrichum liriopes]|uniref:Uncharacterized protein n=1 Tax=Colletotrichum liriopes TaxID=708192 RepID=A0AA37GBS6_9PEZI|nr:hypothetical protein ColLi_00394 [Colletotrichum liriopes]
MYQARGSLTRGNRQQQVEHADLDSWVLDNKGYGPLDCGDGFFSEDEDDDGDDSHSCHEDEMGIAQKEILNAECDDILEFLDETTPSDAPSITLTTPEGELITGDAIPEGTKCHFSDEYHTLQKQWLDTLENNLVPGNWKQLRDLDCPQEPKISYEEEEAARERHLLVEEKKRKRHTEKVARRAHDEERRRQERDAAERAWQLQRMEIEYQKQERWYEAEERRYQAQQLKMQQADADLGKWVEEMDRQQEEAERRLQELRDELEEKMERDFGVEGEDER